MSLLSALVAASHYLALAIGLSAILMRRYSLKHYDANDSASATRILTADNYWALAAFLWIATGVWRAFGGLEKGTAFYVSSPMFWLKMILFVLVILIETKPIVTFIKWRAQLDKFGRIENAGDVPGLIRASEYEIALILIIPIVASLMARGFGSV